MKAIESSSLEEQPPLFSPSENCSLTPHRKNCPDLNFLARIHGVRELIAAVDGRHGHILKETPGGREGFLKLSPGVFS
jgi:hypothetical protein